ncbi:hypothetical protein Fot_50512 [Forsythia ovata]|uniref:Uncharacterized protein n=1 Tax=Forsythia ovata TaxID=205694 RepID=A0ABD1PYC2_9LAMI
MSASTVFVTVNATSTGHRPSRRNSLPSWLVHKASHRRVTLQMAKMGPELRIKHMNCPRQISGSKKLSITAKSGGVAKSAKAEAMVDLGSRVFPKILRTILKMVKLQNCRIGLWV